jgi:hypothetical protein
MADKHDSAGGCRFRPCDILAECPLRNYRLSRSGGKGSSSSAARKALASQPSCALLPSTPYGARIDAEDIGQTSPCPMDDAFFGLLGRNVAGLVGNFWAAGNPPLRRG